MTTENTNLSTNDNATNGNGDLAGKNVGDVVGHITRNDVTLPAIIKQRRPKGDNKEGTLFVGMPDIDETNKDQILAFYGMPKALRRLNQMFNQTWESKYEIACEEDTGEKDAEGNSIVRDSVFDWAKFEEEIQTLHDRSMEGDTKPMLQKQLAAKLDEYSEFIAKTMEAIPGTAEAKQHQLKALEFRDEILELRKAIEQRSRTKANSNKTADVGA